MSRTKRKTAWRPERFVEGEHTDWWGGGVWWKALYQQLLRGHRPGKETGEPARSGGWYGYYFDWWEVSGRNCAQAKKFDKRRSSKMRRREAKSFLRKY